jgi:hypothetical protein
MTLLISARTRAPRWTQRVRVGMLASLVAVLCPASVALAQAVYQCPGPNGQKVFQQAPCTDGARLNVIPTAPMGGSMLGTPEQHRKAVVSAKQQEAVERRDTEVRIAIQQRRVLMGMTENELRASLGPPDETNVGLYNGGTTMTKQWIYRQKNGDTNYVYTRDGVVSSMQWKESRQPEPKIGVVGPSAK